MSSETLRTWLEAIRNLIAAGDTGAALNEVNTLLDAHALAEAHVIRLQLLTPGLQTIDQIAVSLDWLETRCPDDSALPALVEMLDHEINRRVEALIDQADKSDGQLPLEESELLTPLAGRFPAIYLIWGAVMLRAALIKAEGKNDHRTRLQRKLQVYQGKCYAEEREPPFPLDCSPESAREMLRQAVELLPVSEPLHLIAVMMLADAHRLAGDLTIAMELYLRVQATGMAVAEQIEAIRPELARKHVAAILRYVDHLLAEQQFASIPSLLSTTPRFEKLPDVQVRWGDLALLRGEVTEAECCYEATLNLLRSDDTSKVVDLGLDELLPLLRMMPPESMTPLEGADHLPGVRLAFALEDTRHRAQAGLIAVYQIQRHSGKVRALIGQMTVEPLLSAQTMSALLAVIEDGEQQSHRDSYERLRQEAHADWQAECWSAALDKFYELSGSPLATDADLAWLALAMQRGGQSLQAIADLLIRVPPTTWAALPQDAARTMIDVLVNSAGWSVTDQHAAALAGEDSWYSHYQGRRARYLQGALEAASAALYSRRFDDAEREAQRIRSIEPDHPEARLILGQVCSSTGRLSEARTILLPLLNVPETAREATLTLVEVDIARGYLLDAQQRLDELTSSELDSTLLSLKTALENRLAGRPAIRLERITSAVSVDSLRRIPTDSWAAVFAVRLVGVRGARQAPAIREGSADLLMALCQIETLDLHTHFAWRYIGHNGNLTVALLCRVEADTQDRTLAASDTVWQTLRTLLPLRDEVYAYEPVFSAAELEQLTRVEIDSACEIARQESTVSRRRGDGDVYLVYPFAIHDGSQHRLLHSLIGQPRVTVLDIHFQPTTVFPWERSTVLSMLHQHRQSDTEPEVLRDLMEFEHPTRAAPADFRQELAPVLYPEFLLRTQSSAFVVQVHLAAQGHLDSALPNFVRTGLFGTSHCEIVPALSEQDIEIVRRNLREVTCERWSYSAAPQGLERWRHLVTPDEALTATRLPTPGHDGLPGLPVLKIRPMPMPESLPKEGIVIGESVFPVNGRPMTIRIGFNDRMRHTYIVGRTGTGKSTLLQNMALQDIEAGRGVGVIDPHGDLVEAILQCIPAHRIQDVVLFDPADVERPVGLNICDVQGVMEQNMVVADFIGLLYALFDPKRTGIMGPRLENSVRNAMLTIMNVPGYTMIEVVRMLSDEPFRNHMAKRVTDPVLKNYWQNIAPHNFIARGEYNMSDYVTSKFGPFVDDRLLRNIIGQANNTLKFAEIMNTGKILLVNLAKGKIGPQNSHFLGLLLVPQLLVAALSRTRLPVEERRPFCLYVDEFQNFTSPSFGVMLSETRKYGVALTMANQFISQLSEDIREAVFGNVASLFAFQVGIRDAAFLAPELYPADADGLINLPNHHLLAKLPIQGNTSTPFPVRTLPDSRLPNPALAATIRGYSRQRYGRDAFIVSQQIQRRFSQPLD
jgi:tetratricopeptide (TPR) repeat protein